MRVWRYMSKREFSKLLKGHRIQGKDFTKNRNSDSVGVCFLHDITRIGNYKMSALDAFSFLDGIVSDELLCCFEASSKVRFTKSHGWYADPYGGFFSDHLKIEELTLPSYSLKTLELVEVWDPVERKKLA